MAAETRAGLTADEAEIYQYLEPPAESWRHELFLKGRNMTVGHLVYGMRANDLTPEAAAANYDLPLEQVREALRYYERHRDVIEADVDEERRRAAARGIAIDPPAVPR
jgi:uncharacterized protein (DUF433 family)